MKLLITLVSSIGIFIFTIILTCCNNKKDIVKIQETDALRNGFTNPPPSSRPGVYWYFMDGNISREGITQDLESMKKAGIGSLIYLEVNVGVPRGKVIFFSDEWQELFKFAESECRRLDIKMTLGIGPGWTGSGGPWVAPDQSMQHLVSSTIKVSGNTNEIIKLPLPEPKKPYFGEETFTEDLKRQWKSYYEDVAVLAFPTLISSEKIANVDGKALYYRAPFTSVPGVKPYFSPFLSTSNLLNRKAVSKSEVINISDKLMPDGTLTWKIPKGDWTIIRFGNRNNGAITRPSPFPGLGFESDKFDTTALNNHLENYVGKLIGKIEQKNIDSYGGLKMLHMDSWEMGSQNWTAKFREEFTKRRNYDPMPFYPIYAGNIVESLEISERFLWDLRLTSQELVLKNHANHLKKYAHRNGLGLSIEPYDMNPTSDLELGAVADVPMCEFWSKGYGFNSNFSCVEATSIGHINGSPIVQAESFTAYQDAWKQNPSSMKEQGDWAFANGINSFYYHTFQHQPFENKLKPGMAMGPYGVHWDRGQTWWPMVDSYHNYISRCQFMLQQGRTVADILYLIPEGAPHVFQPPTSAMTDDANFPDRKGYNFDGCSPSQLYQAVVKNKKLVFPSGASYQLLVLPFFKTMTPTLLAKIEALIFEGAIVIGEPPVKSPSLSSFPSCDTQIRNLANKIWSGVRVPIEQTEVDYGKGKIIWGGEINSKSTKELYPSYDATAKILNEIGVKEDFKSDMPVRYTHRTTKGIDIYFVCNRTDKTIEGSCEFKSNFEIAEFWNPLTGEVKSVNQFTNRENFISVPLQFEPFESYFVVFKHGKIDNLLQKENFAVMKKEVQINGLWDVTFDKKWGGPEKTVFEHLTDWSVNSDKRIKYYSGIATYKQQFSLPQSTIKNKDIRLYLSLGDVRNLARVNVNGKSIGNVWTNPYKLEIPLTLIKPVNSIEIEVANLWVNRLIGDEFLPDDGIKDGQYPDWLLKGKKRKSGRYAFTTHKFYTKDSILLKSGLLGPVVIYSKKFIALSKKK